MKLLRCLECTDTIGLIRSDVDRVCHCGKSSGRYVDAREVEYAGPAIIIGIDNGALMIADAAAKIGMKADVDGKWFVIREGHHIRKRS